MATVTLPPLPPKQKLRVRTIEEQAQPSSPVCYEWEEEILETYKTYTEGWGYRDRDAKQEIMKKYHISSTELERLLGDNKITADVTLPPIPEKLPTSSVMEYIVYRYIFPTGKIYIGRTSRSTNRLNNVSQYENQYVGKMMKEYPNFKTEIIYETDNILVACYVEHINIEEFYDVSYNAHKEEDWLQKALREISKNTTLTMGQLYKIVEEGYKTCLLLVATDKIIIPLQTNSQK